MNDAERYRRAYIAADRQHTMAAMMSLYAPEHMLVLLGRPR